MTSPIQLEPRQLAGAWVLAVAGADAGCQVELTLSPSGTGHVARADPTCLAGLGLEDVGIWRPAPDGIALAKSEGPIVAFFSKREGCYIHRQASGAELALRRK